MKIGLFGGTFNPPHIGHIWVAQQVLDFTECDEIWMVPSFNHSFQKPAAPVEHRLEMTNLLIQNSVNTHIKICTLEIEHALDGKTIHLLPLLPKEHSYSFIIGSDQLPSFHLWGDWKELLQQIPFLIFPRYGYPNEPIYSGMTMINDNSLVVSNISSTKIRDRVLRGLSIQEFVPSSIEAYIMKYNLYQDV